MQYPFSYIREIGSAHRAIKTEPISGNRRIGCLLRRYLWRWRLFTVPLPAYISIERSWLLTDIFWCKFTALCERFNLNCRIKDNPTVIISTTGNASQMPVIPKYIDKKHTTATYKIQWKEAIPVEKIIISKKHGVYHNNYKFLLENRFKKNDFIKCTPESRHEILCAEWYIPKK